MMTFSIYLVSFWRISPSVHRAFKLMEPCAIEMNMTIIRGTEATVHNSEPGVRAAVCELTTPLSPVNLGSGRVRGWAPKMTWTTFCRTSRQVIMLRGSNPMRGSNPGFAGCLCSIVVLSLPCLQLTLQSQLAREDVACVWCRPWSSGPCASQQCGLHLSCASVCLEHHQYTKT